MSWLDPAVPPVQRATSAPSAALRGRGWDLWLSGRASERLEAMRVARACAHKGRGFRTPSDASGRRAMRVLTILGRKGGVGKSTIASNMLVAAALDGIDGAGLDLDHQGSLARWAGKRYAAGIVPTARVVVGHMP